MNISGVFQREKRHPSQMYHPMHHSVASYWTEAFEKREMRHDFNDDLFLNNIHLIPDPLKKNLADSLFNTTTPTILENMFQEDQKMAQSEVPLQKPPKQTTLGGIGSFFSGVMNVLTSVMFRPRASNYYDCFDVDSQGQGWQHASTDVKDKNGKADECESYDGPPNPNVSSEMNFDSRAVTGCERKLNQVLSLLAPKQTSSPVWVRKRPKKVFVEPGSVGESFEDAFSPEDFSSIPDDSYIEYYSPVQYHCEELSETAPQKTKLNMAPEETMDILKVVTKSCLENDDIHLNKDSVQLEKNNLQLEQQKLQMEELKSDLEQQKVQFEKSELNVEQQTEKPCKTNEMEVSTSTKDHLVSSSSSCEDKLSKLKALLQGNRSKCRGRQEPPEILVLETEPPLKLITKAESPPKMIPKERTADKRFKNPNRHCSKRTKSKLKCRIEDDLVFANEISVGTPPSVENSPIQHDVLFGDYFDEISGRFRTASTGSDDSFQIVFNDPHLRKTSDCDSEDSFIVFEDSPESCYVTNDVFSDSDSESDSGCGTCKLAHNLTRTVSNLADDSLYASEDEVDFGMETADLVEEKTGLLMDERKKLLRKCQPTKKVQFSSDPPKVHVMRVWAFAARQARAGHWERYAVDRERFKRRIADADMALSWVLKPQHRRMVMFQRFMPWWNQLKRKELAEKKEREDEERRREDERQKKELEEVGSQKEVEIRQEEVETPQEDVENNQKRERDVNMNENTDVVKLNITTLNCKDQSNDTEAKDSKTVNVCSQKVVEDDSRINTGSVVDVKKVDAKNEYSYKELNNNLKDDNGKVSKQLIIENEALVKKLQDLEIDDNSRMEIISS